ncbi:hypothetical protein JOQ06_010733, partial [Pogonophryne albipinna]
MLENFERLLRLDREERRKEYRRQDFISLDKIPAWREETRPNDKEEVKELTDGGGPRNKVSLYKGDITVLEVDAIVNAAPGESGSSGLSVSLQTHTLCHNLPDEMTPGVTNQLASLSSFRFQLIFSLSTVQIVDSLAVCLVNVKIVYLNSVADQ